MNNEVLSLRALNRATLARQMLLRRERTAPVEARLAGAISGCVDIVERLAGMQAQEAKPPYIGLWSRLEGFSRTDLLDRVRERKLVRVTAMRGTLHLMSARDYLAVRACLQPMLDSAMLSILKNRGGGIDVTAFVEEARTFFDGREATFNDLRAALAESNPDIDIRAAAYAARMKLPLVQTPDGAAWGWTNDPRFTLATSWLGVEVPAEGDIERLVLRYLGAFGPASIADFQAWAGVKGAKEAFDMLRPRLVTFLDERKRELFDLPDAPRPDAEVAAPVRYLPDFDNLMLGHADRARVIPDEYRQRVATANLRTLASFLVDGMVAGTWKVEVKRKTATLVLDPFEPLAKAIQDELIDEGERLLRFVEPDAGGYVVRFEGNGTSYTISEKIADDQVDASTTMP